MRRTFSLGLGGITGKTPFMKSLLFNLSVTPMFPKWNEFLLRRAFQSDKQRDKYLCLDRVTLESQNKLSFCRFSFVFFCGKLRTCLFYSLEGDESDWPAPSTVWLAKIFNIFPVPSIIAGLKLGRADKVQVLPSPESLSFAETPLGLSAAKKMK